MQFSINEYDGMEHADLLHYLNSFEPSFPSLQSRHLSRGLWWFAQVADGTVIGFAGMVEMHPFDRVYYMKRAYVLPDYRGHGVHYTFIRAREMRARDLKAVKLIGECHNNPPSERNFIRAGFTRFDPEQPWGEHGSVYFEKRLISES